jgi:hypothetical protein
MSSEIVVGKNNGNLENAPSCEMLLSSNSLEHQGNAEFILHNWQDCPKQAEYILRYLLSVPIERSSCNQSKRYM